MCWKRKFTLCRRSVIFGASLGIALGICLQIVIQQVFG